MPSPSSENHHQAATLIDKDNRQGQRSCHRQELSVRGWKLVRSRLGRRRQDRIWSDAATKAAEALKANCPGYQALTPTGRVEAMEKRLQATLGAVRTVQPALAKFYDGLSDEQKARFNSLRSSSRPVG